MGVEALSARRAGTHLGADEAWALVRTIRQRVSSAGAIISPVGVGLDEAGTLVEMPTEDGAIALRPDRETGWAPGRATVEPAGAAVLDLYLPLCVGEHAETLALGHLAQSLDGRVATNGGASQFISGQEDLVHTHRLRALFDAVLVGANTVELDDPRLTTRLCEGDSPTRVVLDGRGRLSGDDRQVFVDGAAPTVIVVGEGHRPRHAGGSSIEVLPVRIVDGWMAIDDVVEGLQRLGLRRLFIEGGGITVSGFLQAGALGRLHVTVAPVLFGSGRPAFALPEIAALDEAIGLRCRHISLGRDILFDCAFDRDDRPPPR
ncbi:MAG: RibD family protein [Myxococcota bacterium]